MQSQVLSIVIGLLAAVLTIFWIINRRKNKQFLLHKQVSDVDEIFLTHFSYVDRSIFFKTWSDLAEVFGVPIEKLDVGDKISDFVKGRHLPELYMEKIEVYFQSQGIDPAEININITLGELLTKLFGKKMA